ncbi:MAG: hypothetical protein NPIRA04_29560 [Nitrospirales bacterium]|nr:MAG: hypothetical protein NPIRA04_29560 [Nitrospirales bacterium]
MLVVGGITVGAFQRSVLADSPKEYQVKAAFLYHFVQFAEWPKQAFSDPGMRIRICVYGDDPFAGYLVKTFMGKSLHSRQFIVQPRVSALDIESCHVLFMNRQIDVSQQEVQRALQRSQALTVGESEDFLKFGGMIQFYRVENNIRFAVNSDVLDQKDLHLSSKLLRLARIVKSK